MPPIGDRFYRDQTATIAPHAPTWEKSLIQNVRELVLNFAMSGHQYGGYTRSATCMANMFLSDGAHRTRHWSFVALFHIHSILSLTRRRTASHVAIVVVANVEMGLDGRIYNARDIIRNQGKWNGSIGRRDALIISRESTLPLSPIEQTTKPSLSLSQHLA